MCGARWPDRWFVKVPRVDVPGWRTIPLRKWICLQEASHAIRDFGIPWEASLSQVLLMTRCLMQVLCHAPRANRRRARLLETDGGKRCEGGCSRNALALAGLFAWSDSRSEPTLLFYRKLSGLGPRFPLGRRKRQPRPDLACEAFPIVSCDQAEGSQTHGSFLYLLELASHKTHLQHGGHCCEGAAAVAGAALLICPALPP